MSTYTAKNADGTIVYFGATGAGTSSDPYVVTPSLPTGAATSAKQDTGNTSLSSIDGKLSAVGEVAASPTANTILDRLKALLTGIVLAAGSARVGKITVRNAADGADIDPLAEATFTGRLGEVQASPTANTVLDRLKALLTGIVLATGSNIVGRFGIDQTTPGTTNRVDIGVITAGETHVGEVGSPNDVIAIAPTVSTSPAYTAGDAVGGKQTLTSACRVSGGKAVLESITVVEKGTQKAALTILFFESDPTAATITDNAGFVFSTNDVNCIGKINIATSDYETVNSKSVATVKGIGLTLKGNGTANIYVAVITTGTPTYASTTDLKFFYGILQG